MFLEHKIMIKNIYNKSIRIAGHKNSKKFLGFISFIESFIFPIPPDVFIIPMTIAKKNEWKKIELGSSKKFKKMQERWVGVP